MPRMRPKLYWPLWALAVHALAALLFWIFWLLGDGCDQKNSLLAPLFLMGSADAVATLTMLPFGLRYGGRTFAYVWGIALLVVAGFATAGFVHAETLRSCTHGPI